MKKKSNKKSIEASRTNTIEFSTVNLDMLDFQEQDTDSVEIDNDLLKSSFMNIKEALGNDSLEYLDC